MCNQDKYNIVTHRKPLVVKGLTSSKANIEECRPEQEYLTASCTHIVKGVPAQTANLQEWQNSNGTILAKIDNNGCFIPAQMTDDRAANGSLYYSIDRGKLVFKDLIGIIKNLT